MPSLVRLKSILRYSRLAPPPRWRAVLRPRALRPPDFLRPSTSDFSGSLLVISAKSGYVTKRRPGEVGFGLRMGIAPVRSDDRGGAEGLHALEVGFQSLEDRDRVALAHLHDGLLPGPRAAGGDAAALGLGGNLGRAHLEHLDVIEQRL